MSAATGKEKADAGGIDPKSVRGYATASPIMQTILDRLDEVRWIGPGRWLATCPCCGVAGGAEFADIWQGAEVASREAIS